jgi:hypothetical protein
MEYDGGYSVRENDVYNLGNVIIGNFSGTEIEGFFAYQLPDLDGESFQSAKLNFEISNHTGETGSLDLYAYRFSTANAMSEADFGAAGTLLKADFFGTGTSDLEKVSTGTTLGVLNTWIKDNYAANSYVTFILRKSDPMGNGSVYFVAGGDGESTAPTLTITAVPEAAAFSLIACIMIGINALRGCTRKRSNSHHKIRVEMGYNRFFSHTR